MPIRTCVGCRARVEQSALVRVVADPVGRLKVDRARREAGRGAWVHAARSCVEAALRGGGFARSFRRRLQPIEPDRLWNSIVETAEMKERSDEQR
jgi:hypothetical protein